MNIQASQIQILEDQEDEINLKNYWRVFKRKWWLVAIVFIAFVSLAAIYQTGIPKQYEATAIVKIPSSGSGGGLSVDLGAFLSIGSADNVATEIEVIKRRNIAEQVIADLKLDKKEEYLKLDRRRIILGFQGMLKVEQKGRTNLIKITANSNSSEEARNIANKVAEEYIRVSKISGQKVWNDLMDQMEARLEQARADLANSRQLLHTYEAEEGITAAFSPLLIGAGTSVGNTQYVVPEIPQAVAKLKADIMGMEIQLEGLRKSFSDADSTIISLKKQITASREKLRQEEKKAIEKYNKQFGLTQVAAEVMFNQQLYSMLVSKQEELKAQYIVQNKSPEVIEKAVEPIYPSKTGRKLILAAGAILGLLLGLGAAFFGEFLDDSIHTTQDVTALLDIPVLASIPNLRSVKKNLGKIGILGKEDKQGSERNMLLTHYYTNPSRNGFITEFYKESFRIFQLKVVMAIDGKVENIAGTQHPVPSPSEAKESSIQHKDGLALLVTSSVPKEGRSIVTTNLAISIAQTGRKVLLVDADCRNAAQHKLLDLDVQMGLMDVLAGDVMWGDVVKNTSIDNLCAITVGGGDSQLDPSALFASPRLDSFISLSRAQFDVTIFDSPQAMLASEPAVIGSKVDGIVFVIKTNDTQKSIILHAKQKIQDSGGNILGAVLNYAPVEKKYLRV